MLFRPFMTFLRLPYTGPAETIGPKQLFSRRARLKPKLNCTLLTETTTVLGLKHIFIYRGSNVGILTQSRGSKDKIQRGQI